MDNELVERQNRALNVLVEAVRVAQSKGAFSLEQAALVAEAVAVFQPSKQTVSPQQMSASKKTEV